MAKPAKPKTPTGKTSAPGQMAKSGGGTARSYAPGQQNRKARPKKP